VAVATVAGVSASTEAMTLRRDPTDITGMKQRLVSASTEAMTLRRTRRVSLALRVLDPSQPPRKQ